MSEPHASCQRMDPINLICSATLKVIHHFHDPVIVLVADGSVPIARYFVVELGDWGSDRMGM